MMISRELIERFFEKRCTEEEAALVSDYLKRHPEVLEEYLGEKEWDDAGPSSVMPPVFWEGVWKDIQGRKQRGKVLVWVKRSAVAASVAVMLGWGYYQFVGPQAAEQAVAVAAAPARHRMVSNTSQQIMRFALQDSSIVELSPQSVLEYEEPFQNNQRAIHLKGAATFEVAKDQHRPFTVYANNIATTALGTRFSVNTLVNSKVAVRLFEGKVVVCSIADNTNIKDIFLSPGEEFTVDKQSGLFAVQHFDSKPKPAERLAGRDKDRSRAAAVLAFDRTSLPRVFDRISAYYHVNVIYDRTAINDLQFTGTFLETDALNAVLSVICNMNGLSYTQEQNSVTIAKVK